jgi:hypothetical protein
MKDQKKIKSPILFRISICVTMLIILLAVPYQSIAQDEPVDLINSRPQVSTLTILGEVFLGAVGNVVGGYTGGYAGLKISSGDDGDWFEGLGGALIGYSVGSTCGSALGVYLIGNSRNIRGSFGSALLGSLIGEVAASGLALLAKNGTVALISFIALPPIGAAVLFNRSLRYKTPPVSHALLNVKSGSCRLGFPKIQIKPVAGYIKNVKPKLGFKINLVSIEL